jgi:hypothetical protein
MLLGDNATSHLLALRIYFSLGVTSYICDGKRSFLSLINPAVRFFPVYSDEDASAALFALDYAASNADYLPLLVPCSALFRELVEVNRDHLETRFILSDSDSVFSSLPLSRLL